MAISTIKSNGIWENVSITVPSGVGICEAYKNDSIKLAVVCYNSAGNSNVDETFALPSSIKPKFQFYSALRGNGYLSANENGTISINCPSSYSPGEIVFAIQ